MTRPRLTLEVVPSANGKIYYLPLAPKAEGEIERLKIAVGLRIKHIDRTAGRESLKINRILFSFPGTTIGAREMRREPQYIDPSGGTIDRGETAAWSNGSVCLIDTEGDCPNDEKHYNQIYLDSPAPPQLKIGIFCEGIDDPYTEVFDLIPWTDPTGFGPLRIPFAVSDLAANEYVVTRAVHWYNGGSSGTQIYAHDINIQAYEDGAWTENKVDSPTANTQTRTFGRPVRAMAHGKVLAVVDGFSDNRYGTDRSRNYGSNYVRVKYGKLEVWYKHLKHDSAVVEVDDMVVAGQKLAEAGNSGNTSHPHLHMECRLHDSETLCGFVFKDASIIAKSEVPDDGTEWPRVPIDGRGICEEKSAIRPWGMSVVPPRFDASIAEHAAIVAEIFGGASQGGDGFGIVNGKIIRIPPRGIKAELLNILDELNSADELSKVRRSSVRKNIALKIAKLAAALKR